MKKYELNGALRELIPPTSLVILIWIYPIDVDHYWIKVGIDSRGNDRGVTVISGFPELYWRETKSGGSYDARFVNTGILNVPRASQNIAFNILRPMWEPYFQKRHLSMLS